MADKSKVKLLNESKFSPNVSKGCLQQIQNAILQMLRSRGIKVTNERLFTRLTMLFDSGSITSIIIFFVVCNRNSLPVDLHILVILLKWKCGVSAPVIIPSTGSSGCLLDVKIIIAAINNHFLATEIIFACGGLHTLSSFRLNIADEQHVSAGCIFGICMSYVYSSCFFGYIGNLNFRQQIFKRDYTNYINDLICSASSKNSQVEYRLSNLQTHINSLNRIRNAAN